MWGCSSSRRPSPDDSPSRPSSKTSVRWGMTSRLPAGLVPSQLSLEHLAGGVAGQLVHELDVARDLVGGEVGLDEPPDLVLAQGGALAPDDDRLRPLAELLVRDAEARRLGDRLMAGEQLLDLGREDVLPARDDHVVVTAVDEQPSLRVEVTDVARRHQAVHLVLAAAARVAIELQLVADEDAARPALADGLALLVVELHDRAAGRPARRARRLPQVPRGGDRRPRHLG